MPGWGYHWGYGWVGGLIMIGTMILFWGGLITVIVVLIHRLGAHRPEQNGARRILDERFARGEIDRDEYEQHIRTLRTGH